MARQGRFTIWRGEDAQIPFDFPSDESVTGLAFDFVATAGPSAGAYGSIPSPDLTGTAVVTSSTRVTVTLAHAATRVLDTDTLYYQLRRKDSGNYTVVGYGEVRVELISGAW